MSERDINPADEKAVAEFRRPCRYNGVFDDEGPCCCSACDLHEFALTVAARIRAEAARDISAANARAERACESLQAAIEHICGNECGTQHRLICRELGKELDAYRAAIQGGGA